MAIVVGRRVRRTQPQQNAQIDWNNPITAGLAFAYTCGNEAQGWGEDGRNGIPYTLIDGTPTGRQVNTLSGTAGQMIDVNSYYLFTVNQTSMTTSRYSLFAFGTAPTSNTQSPIDDDDGTTRRFQFRVNAGKAEFIPFYSGGNGSVISPVALSTNDKARGFSMGAVANGTAYAVYQNGVKTSATLPGTILAPNSNLFIGARKTNNVQQWLVGGLMLVAGWSRALTDAEQASLAANPWQIFKPAARRLWAKPSTSVDSTATTSQGQTAAAVASVSLAASATTSQAQTSAALANVSLAASATSSQAQRVAARDVSTGSVRIDNAVNGTASGASTQTLTLSTSKPNDIIVVLAYAEQTTPPSVSGVSGAGLTFTRRNRSQGSAIGNLELWWAVAADPLSAVDITITYAAAFDKASATALAVSGCDTGAPWDTNASASQQQSGAGEENFLNPSFTVTSDAGAGMVLYATGTASNACTENAPGGFVVLTHAYTGDDSPTSDACLAARSFSSALSNATFAGDPVDPGEDGAQSLLDVLVAGAPVPARPGQLTIEAGTNGCGSDAISYTFGRLTTFSANAVIVVLAYAEMPGTQPNIASITGGGLSFARRGRAHGSAAGDLELWWALAASPLLDVDLTITYDDVIDDCSVVVMAVAGCDPAAPWDTNAGSSHVQSDGGSDFSPSFTVSTDATNALLIGGAGSAAFGLTSTGTPPAGFLGLGGRFNENGSYAYANVTLAVKAVSARQDGVTVTWGGDILANHDGGEALFEALVAAPSFSGSTSQAQTSAASAAVAANATATASQAQTSGASAALSSSGAVQCAQAQRADAAGGVALAASASSAQAQTTVALAGTDTPASVSTTQAQGVAAQAGVSADGAATTSQCQRLDAALGVVVDAVVSGASAQRVDGTLIAGSGAGTATAQGQTAGAVVGVSTDTQGATAQAQGGTGAGAVGVAVDAATSQEQRVDAQARAEAADTTATSQPQSVSGTLELASDAVAATAQGQHVALLADLPLAVAVVSAQVQSAGAHLIMAGEAIAATAQARQHVAGELLAYETLGGTLAPDAMRVRPALSPDALRASPALAATIHVRPAWGGRVDARPDR